MVERMWAAAGLVVILGACSSGPATTSGIPACPAGQVVQYTPTGVKYCTTLTADVGTLDSSKVEDTATGSDATTADNGAKPDSADAATPPDVGADVAKSDPYQCPPEAPNAALGKHGTKCTQNSDCMYGTCVFGSPLVGYDPTIGFCTKNCACPDKSAVCSNDDTGMADTYKCVMEKTVQSGNDKRDPAKPVLKMCARVCQKDAECAAWNPELPHCMTFSNKYVSVPAGVCGKDPFK